MAKGVKMANGINVKTVVDSTSNLKTYFTIISTRKELSVAIIISPLLSFIAFSLGRTS
jgi:hypothetical protein